MSESIRTTCCRLQRELDQGWKDTEDGLGIIEKIREALEAKVLGGLLHHNDPEIADLTVIALRKVLTMVIAQTKLNQTIRLLDDGVFDGID
jgi:hypothetical protein